MQIKEIEVEKLIPYANNSRTHDDAQVAQLAASIKEFGFRNPILVDGVGIIAGHGRLLAARKLGLDKVPTIDCSDMTEIQKKAYIIADNKLALNAGWDNNLLSLELEQLDADKFNLELLGFSADELKLIFEDNGESSDNDSKYTKKIEAPVYIPSGDCPPILNLFENTKYLELYKKIEEERNIDSELREFLFAAAGRHIRFDFEQIAEYYAHATPNVQALMEDSALVIIDFDKAITDGYVKLTKAIGEIYLSEHDEE
jgi:hypothetical protein